MLINLRNALMAGKRLPYDAEVEYLESSGTQYIDTGVKPSNDLRTKFRAAYTHTPIENNSTIFGSRSTASSNDRYWLNYDSKFEVGYGSYYNTGVTVSPGEIFDVDFNYIENGDHKFKINDSVFTYSGTPNTTIGIILFGRIVGAQVTRCSSRFYSAQFFRNGVLVRDLIPVRKGTVGYLYDRVSGKLFGNAGTGDFVLGPDVVPVEYIESHGTEWIDTGVVPAANDSFYCRVKQSVDRDQCFWGLAGVAYCFSNGTLSGNGTYWGHPAIGIGGVAGVNPLGSTDWKEILCQSSGIFVDGVQINTQVTAPAQSPLNTVALFARAVNSAGGGVAKNGEGRMSEFRIERNATTIRSFRPVRVGTEGAMMDVLTRRIYRNAGTGAFTYGNDLKYPIPAE